MENQYTIRLLKPTFAICRLDAASPLPSFAQGSFISITRTPDELSVVCEEAFVPQGICCVRGRAALKVDGPLDFAITGLLAKISAALAENGVSIFAISTYDTDYVLIQRKDLQTAKAALENAGFNVVLD